MSANRSSPTHALSPLRWARTLVLAVVALALGVGGHAAVSGAAPGATRLAMLAAILVALLLPATRRELSGPSLTLLLAAGQGLVHLAATLPAVASTATTPHALLCDLTGAQPGTGSAGSLGWLAVMASAHVATTILSAAWLRRGERLAWKTTAGAARRVLSALARSLPTRIAAVLVAPPCIATPAAVDVLHRQLPASAPRRGPPRLSVA